MDDQPPLPRRKHPAHGVFIDPVRPAIVFLTVCTEGRQPWLATEHNHALLRAVWSASNAWLIGRYVLMPDHLHLFAAPGVLPVPFDNWVRFWKSQFRKQHADKSLRWQVDHWDTRLRNTESYAEKWDYVVNNPVRHGLVGRAEEWPHRGELHELRWD